MNRDEYFMKEAIRLSIEAVRHGNEPFGSVLVKDDKIVCTNENQIFSLSDPTWHGETGLIRKFCHENGIMDLSAYTLYTSCEPCFMCSGAMVWARLGTLVYAAGNIELEQILGSQGSDCSRIVFMHSGHQPVVRSGVLREESLEVLRSYFGKKNDSE